MHELPGRDVLRRERECVHELPGEHGLGQRSERVRADLRGGAVPGMSKRYKLEVKCHDVGLLPVRVESRFLCKSWSV